MASEITNGDLVQPPEGWRIAIKAFDDAEFQFGATIGKSWLYDAFGIPEPQPQTSLKQAQEAQLRFLACLNEFKDYLLNERSMALRTVYGVGYEIVLPEEQTEWAEDEFKREAAKVFSKAGERLLNVDHSRLTTNQTQKNADALARLAGLRALTLGKRPLPSDAIRNLIAKQGDQHNEEN